MSVDWQELLGPWRQVATKVDAFFARVVDEHGAALACRAGCAACCQQELSFTLIEALAVVATLEALPAAQRASIAEQAAASGPPCAMLDHEGRCRIYAGRPLTCRSHGLPIRQDDAVAACQLNFGGGADGYPAEATMNATIVTAGLTVANLLLGQRLGFAVGDQRFALRELAQRGRDALPATVAAALPAR